MVQHIYKCLSCRNYTFEDKCPQCSGKTILPRPPKFSLTDKYAALRREMKKKALEEKGQC